MEANPDRAALMTEVESAPEVSEVAAEVVPAVDAMVANPGASVPGSSPQPSEHPYTFDGIREDNASQPHEFGRTMHETGASQEQVAAALGYARSFAAKESARIEAADNEDRAALATDMKLSWGQDYPLHIQAINGFLDTLPPIVEDALTNARTLSGSKLLNTPEGLEWLASLATGAGSPRTEQRANAEHLLKTNRREYFRNPQAQLADRKALSEPETQEAALRPSVSIEVRRSSSLSNA
jgi:hypothetical protein